MGAHWAAAPARPGGPDPAPQHLEARMPDQTISTQHLNDLRRRIANGHDYNYKEVKEAIQGLRQQRQEHGDNSSAPQNKKGGGGKKQEAKPDLSDLMGE